MPSPFHAIEVRAASQRAQAQAAARPARVRFFVDVSGAGEGEARFEDGNRLLFSTFMLEEPIFTWGVAIVGGQSLSRGNLPLCTVTVLRYESNDRNFYTGADIGIRVRSAAERLNLRFSLVFDGYALRHTSRVAEIGS